MSLKEQVKELSREELEAKFINLHNIANNLIDKVNYYENEIKVSPEEITLMFKLLKLSEESISQKRIIRKLILELERTNDNLLYIYLKKFYDNL